MRKTNVKVNMMTVEQLMKILGNANPEGFIEIRQAGVEEDILEIYVNQETGNVIIEIDYTG